jgi:hypothetical protein
MLGSLDSSIDADSLIEIALAWYSDAKVPMKLPIPVSSKPMKSAPVAKAGGNRFEQKLAASIDDFERLLKLTPDAGMHIRKVITVMKTELSQYRHHGRARSLRLGDPSFRSTKEEARGLREIYMWYSSQHKRHGRNPTFEDMAIDG